jgi:nicotinamidase/pyrazinamidase
MVEYVTKGSNPHTEHYSGLLADVPDPSDITTQLNKNLIDTLESVDIILVAGEASSHCVANSIRDLISNFQNFDCAKKIVILEDAMSPVGGFENLTTDFFNEMKSKGVSFSTTDKFLI